MSSQPIHDVGSRRRFLWTGLAAAGAALAQSCAKPYNLLKRERVDKVKKVPPSEKINVAAIGIGGKGMSDIMGMMNTGEVNLVALCDVDFREGRHKETLAMYPDIPRYQDFRIMLDEMDREIDAVTISTPDHIHAPAAMSAMSRGMHVFCQKPLTHNIMEARLLTETARKMNVATQMGIQGHASLGIRRIYEWVRQNAVGEIREIHVWTNRPGWPQGIHRPLTEDPVPEGLDWNVWLGPAQERPYADGTYHPGRWRGWFDFGAGALGDIGCHSLDAPFWSLDLGYPTRVSAETAPLTEETYPKWSIVTYEFPARGDWPAVKLVWRDGKKEVDGKEEQNMPPRPEMLEEGRSLQDNGQLYFGENAAIMCGMYAESPRVIPESAMSEFLATNPDRFMEKSMGPYMEFVRACKGGEPAGACFDYAGPLTEIVHLGNLAIRSQESIEFDPVSMKVTNVSRANQFLCREYREGWKI